MEMKTTPSLDRVMAGVSSYAVLYFLLLDWWLIRVPKQPGKSVYFCTKLRLMRWKFKAEEKVTLLLFLEQQREKKRESSEISTSEKNDVLQSDCNVLGQKSKPLFCTQLVCINLLRFLHILYRLQGKVAGFLC